MILKFSTLTRSDLKEINSYLREHGEKPSQAFRKSFESFCSQVSNFPFMYSICEYHTEYRKAVIAFDYLVYYKVDNAKNEILIFRVLHGKRNVKQMIQETDVL